MAAKTATKRTVKELDVITRVLGNMVVVPEGGFTDLDHKIDTLETKIAGVNGLKTNRRFFAFEVVDEQLEEETDKLNAKLTNLKMARLGYKELDFSFLSWSKKDTRLPALIVLTLNSNEFKMTVEPRDSEGNIEGRLSIEESNINIEPDLPDAITDKYIESAKHLAQISVRSHEWDDISITAEYRSGVMPDALRTKVTEAINKDTFDNIYIIAEAPKWKVEYTVRVKGDPLVVGWKDETNQMFLIGSYDPTPLETYIEEQFVN